MNIDQRLRLRIDNGQDEIIGGFCRDCRWAELPPKRWYEKLNVEDWEAVLCLSPNREVDLVSGDPRQSTCGNQRRFGRCGRPGYWFEPRETS